MNKQFSQEVLDQIETKKIMPLPRWRFSIARLSFWFITIISLVAASIAAGASLFILLDFRRHSLGEIPHDLTEVILMIPFIWILILTVAVFFTNFSFKQTGRGYRYQLWVILFASLLVSLVLGAVMMLVGVGQVAHQWFGRVSIYDSVVYDPRDAWNQHTVGRLGGIIVSIDDDRQFSVLDFGGEVWQVRVASSTIFIPVASSTILMSGLYSTSSKLFIADCIHDWSETGTERNCPGAAYQ